MDAPVRLSSARIAGIVAGLVASLGFAAPSWAAFSDEFGGTSLSPGWTALSPNVDSGYGLTGSGSFRFVASPNNGGSDLFVSSNWNAPRLLQPIDPTKDWRIETKLTVNAANDFQDGGILLSKTADFSSDPDDFWRVMQRAYQLNGGNVVRFNAVNIASYSNSTVYFRVDKVGEEYSGFYSSDGTNWLAAGSAQNLGAWSYIGIDAVRQPWDGNTAVYTVADFDYFRITVTPEPSTLALMALAGGIIAARSCRPRH